MRLIFAFLVACGGGAETARMVAPELDGLDLEETSSVDMLSSVDAESIVSDAAPSVDTAPAGCGAKGQTCCTSNFVSEKCPWHAGINPSNCDATTNICVACGVNGAPCCHNGASPTCLGGMHCSTSSSATPDHCF